MSRTGPRSCMCVGKCNETKLLLLEAGMKSGVAKTELDKHSLSDSRPRCDLIARYAEMSSPPKHTGVNGGLTYMSQPRPLDVAARCALGVGDEFLSDGFVVGGKGGGLCGGGAAAGAEVAVPEGLETGLAVSAAAADVADRRLAAIQVDHGVVPPIAGAVATGHLKNWHLKRS